MNHLERALDHQNQWWKYLVVLLAAVLGAQVIGAMPLVIAIIYKAGMSDGALHFDPDKITDFSYYGISPSLGLFLMVLPFIVGLATMALMLKPLHKRSLFETINGRKSIRWNRFFFAASIWMALMAVFLIVDYLMHPKNFQIQFDIASFIPLAIVSILAIPFQASFEEVVFRGYMAQGIGAWTRSRWLAIIIPSILFALMHDANPEVKEFGFWLAMPQYLVFGLAFGLISTLDDGIEGAMGAHAANNVFSSIFVTYDSSVLQTPALFHQLKVDPATDMVTLLISCVVFMAILSKKYQWKFGVLNKKVNDFPVYTDPAIEA